MRRLLIGALIGAGALPSPPVRASTGNEVLAECNAESTSFKATYCFGFVVGAVEMASAFMAIADRNWFCAPPKVTNGQLQRIVIKYIEDNPAKTADPAAFLVLSALTEAFPCPKK